MNLPQSKNDTPPYRTAITGLRLESFRSYQQADISCPSDSVVLSGANGAGKTNILEAISLIAERRGLRRAKIEDLAYRGSGYCGLAADIIDHHGLTMAQIRCHKSSRDIKIDGVVRTNGELAALVPQLWLTPAMDHLFTDAASARRLFFDRFICGLTSTHQYHLNQHEKAMRERNHLLAHDDTQERADWLASLEQTMATHAIVIAGARLDGLDTLAHALTETPLPFPRAEIALIGDIEAELRTNDPANIEANYRAQLSAMRPRDTAARRTLAGIHKTDLIVTHATHQMPARLCSTGEQKALLIGLVLAQAQAMSTQNGRIPLLLLDEIVAHLDASTRAALYHALIHLKCQAWMTGTERDYFSDFKDKITHFRVKNGIISN